MSKDNVTSLPSNRMRAPLPRPLPRPEPRINADSTGETQSYFTLSHQQAIMHAAQSITVAEGRDTAITVLADTIALLQSQRREA